MRPQDDIDYTTLAWVKGELDETLNQARQALEAYVEDPTDVSQMRFCATYLHQVQGTLRMVELYGAAMVTEEMEHLAAALLDGGPIADRDEAYAVLMRGIMQLPDYLERLQSGHKDIPIVLLPLLNDLRAARGEKGLSEIALFTPNLGRDLPGAAQGPAQPLPEAELRSRAEQLRAAFQLALLKWFRNDDVDANLDRLTETCDKLVGLTAEVEARRLFWVTAGVLEALRAKSFEPSLQLKQTVGKVEREIKRLADAGEKSFRADPPRELTRDLLYFVAHAPTQHGRIGELRNVFNLAALLPSEQEVEHARSSLTGHNRSLLDTVSSAIKEDLMRVKDALDLHLRNPDAQSAQLSSQIEVLERVSDTLGMLGLGVARRVVQEQRDAVQSVVNGDRAADESTLLDIAGALLYVEASLDDQVQHLGGTPAGEDASAKLPSIETRRVMQALVKEAQTNFTRAKQCFVGFIESSWDADQLKEAPELLDQVAGALRIVELPEPAGYLDAIGRFTERELLEKRRVPGVVQMETLADALASLEYFLEAQGEQRPGRERILHTARGSLEKLGYWPLPDAIPAVAEAPADAAAVIDAAAVADPFGDVAFDATAALVEATGPATQAAAFVAEPALDVRPGPTREPESVVEPVVAEVVAPEPAAEAPAPIAVAPEPVAAPSDGPIVGGFEAASEEIDEEIREVFVEEVAEEIDNLTELLPPWVDAPANLEQLKSIRRVFHTLKGSGRLVGAMTLGEFSWKVENMLNRVLDHTIQPTPSVIGVVQAAHGVLPEILAALRGERSVRTSLEAIKDVADRLSAGEQAHYTPTPVAEPEPVAPVPDAVEDAVVEDVVDIAVETEAGIGIAADEAQEAFADIAIDIPELEIETTFAQASDIVPDAAPEPVEAAADDGDRILVPAIDSVLFDILKPEVSGHLDTVDTWLAEGPHPVTDDLVRAVHTMNGAFAMTEVPVVTEVTAPLENYLKRALAQSGTPTPEGFRVLGDAASALRNVLEELDAESPRLTPLSDLAARIAVERDLLPEAFGPTVPVHLTGEFDEIPTLTTAVSLDVETVEAVPVAEAEAPQAVVQTQDPDEGMLDIAALDALGEESISLDGIGLEGLDAEVAAFLAEESAQAAAETDAARVEDAAFDMAGFGTVTASDADVAEAIEETEETIEWEAFSAQDAELDVAVDVPLLDVVENELPAPEESVALYDDALAVAGTDEQAVEASFQDADFDAPEPVVPISDAEVAAAFAPATDEIAPVDSPVSSGMDDLIRSWLAGEIEPAVDTAPEAVATDDVSVLEATVDAVSAGTEEEPSASEARAGIDGAGIVSADTFFEAVLEDEPSAVAETDVEAVDTASQETPAIEPEEEQQPVIEQEAFADGIAIDEADVPAEEVVFASFAGGDDLSERVEVQTTQADEDATFPVIEEEAIEDVFIEDEAPVTTDEAELVAAVEFEETIPAVETHAAPVATPDTSADARVAAWFLEGLDGSDPDPEAPLSLPDMDEELLDIFAEEASDILDHADGYMVQLRETQDDQDVVVALQRDLHTLKGGARMAGLNPIGDLGHVMESLLEIVAEGRRVLPRYGVDVLELAFDRLNRMTARVASRQAIATPALLIQRVDMLARGETPELEVSAPDVVEAAVASVVEIQPVVAIPTVTPEAVPTALDDEDVTIRAPQEQIRIRADLLDRLVNYAGEVAIYRARLEQQLGLFRGNLAELEQTNERLRGQLRKLEIETEAQIVARYQREAEVGGEQVFDPLELDRFSTLQQLTRALSESAADLVNLQGTLEDHTRQYETLLLQQSRVSSDLQEGLMRTRMVPFDSLVPRMRRIIRQTAGELGKKAQLRVEGAQGEMDRSVLDRMTAPLEHMLRNSLAHGLETPAERIAAGKPEEGTIKVAVSREGSEVVIKVTDDGRGLNRDAIRRKAIERGLLAPDVQVSDRELYTFILAPGFSTAASVSKVAGRGVGMDVVHSEIRQLGGSLNIESQPGHGSVFTIRLPFTLAVTQAVFVQQGDTSYAVPIASVQGVARIDRDELDVQLATGEPNFVYAGENYRIHDLGRLLGQAPVRAEGSLQVPLLLARSGDLRVAICVDNVIGSREIVVKPVGAQVSSIPGIFGATIMGDGRVIVILDVAPLARRYAAQHRDDVPEAIVPAEPVRRVPLVMVVDDSITMRKVTGRVLERHGYEVLTAKDGVDAVEKLADRVPDVMLLDIEMPRMDGYELATHIRNDVRLRGIPIIMITSRTGEKHRQRAFEIGVDRYLGKPYQEADLMRNVDEILKVQRGDLG